MLLPFTIQEITSTINTSSKNKATGPLGISNEILKHLPSIAISHLLDIFNACIELEITPNQWLKSNIWPIPKKSYYTHDLNTTRPITLIDHTRKIFTKMITKRLTEILARNSVLSPYNFAALPHQSTLQPIQHLTNIMEDALTTK